MGPWGALIFAIFATAFFMAGLAPTVGQASPILLLGLVLAAPIVIRAIQRVVRPDPPGGIQTGRVIMWSTMAEAVGILLIVNIFHAAHMDDVILPGIAAVVSLHFIPIGLAANLRRFQALTAAMMACAVAGFAIRGATGTMVTGLGAALTLWIGGIFALQRPTYG
ncbi:hypothetical protein HZF05_13380 [Sphingomonas sp. CGMCC 1.13654]|uniref:Uncharacterized protein n=1 Tax=Sphingomonas chungangi TaxID=2683589 RepID=A0A838L7T7_9SPHN|nr:hypothetical protein [Sphingomonas chungangi]MBA2935087.1 hypothetical protein [Sphingomonas chungangi]MVW54203.1 hypothetical protein [Sphingomonas chungangi]